MALMKPDSQCREHSATWAWNRTLPWKDLWFMQKTIHWNPWSIGGSYVWCWMQLEGSGIVPTRRNDEEQKTIWNLWVHQIYKYLEQISFHRAWRRDFCLHSTLQALIEVFVFVFTRRDRWSCILDIEFSGQEGRNSLKDVLIALILLNVA